MVKSFFHEETADSIAVEDEVCSIGVLVAEHTWMWNFGLGWREEGL